MKAITVTFLGPTNTHGSRYKASDGDGNAVTVPSAYDGDVSKRRAAIALCRKMGWHGTLAHGGTKDAEVFVFVEPDSTITIPPSGDEGAIEK